MIWFLVFIISFLIMEFNAWWLHKYVMHGFLWNLHKDHHNPQNRWWQYNDFFAFFFAVPSFLFILFNELFHLPLLGACGYGIMAYGIVYFLVHEVLIHRRLEFLKYPKNKYFKGLVKAHKIHHSNNKKYGCTNFGMLIVPIKYFR